MNSGAPTRQVIVGDAIDWLRQASLVESASIIASLPDYSEFPGKTLAEWQGWFRDTAALILMRTPERGVSIFFQSDIKHEGQWIDKAALVQRAAEDLDIPLLWHKIACRVPAGQPSFGRPGFSHVLCFSRAVRLDAARSTADVIPDLGEKTWERGMGLEVCLMIAKFLREIISCNLLVHPFCGQGSMLAVANAFGISGIGIERSPKRAAMAERLKVNLELKQWIDEAQI